MIPPSGLFTALQVGENTDSARAIERGMVPA